MPSKAEKLLEKMRNSKSNWKRADLDKLYEGYDFVISHGGIMILLNILIFRNYGRLFRAIGN